MYVYVIPNSHGLLSSAVAVLYPSPMTGRGDNGMADGTLRGTCSSPRPEPRHPLPVIGGSPRERAGLGGEDQPSNDNSLSQTSVRGCLKTGNERAVALGHGHSPLPLCHGSDRRRIASHPATPACPGPHGASTSTLVAHHSQRDLLSAPHWGRLAFSAPGMATLADGVPLSARVAAGWDLGATASPTAGTAAHPTPAQSPAERRVRG